MTYVHKKDKVISLNYRVDKRETESADESARRLSSLDVSIVSHADCDPGLCLEGSPSGYDAIQRSSCHECDLMMLTSQTCSTCPLGR